MVSLNSNAAYLIDASIYFFRAYFTLPDRWQSEQGYSTNGLYGYVQFLLQLLDRHQPELIASAFDESLGTGFRHELYPDYKASRSLPDDEIKFQLDACREVTELLGIYHTASDRYETDDLLATLARRLWRTKRQIVIVSRDKDLGQLIRPDAVVSSNVVIENKSQLVLFDYGANEIYDAASFHKKMDVYPNQLVDYLILVGDPVDDIPGVPGIGKKTAVALLDAYGSIDGIFSNLESLPNQPIRGAKNLADKLMLYREQIHLVRSLVETVDTIPLSITAKTLHWQMPELMPLLDFFRKMGLGKQAETRLIKLFESWV